jgi:hypothetical protein
MSAKRTSTRVRLLRAQELLYEANTINSGSLNVPPPMSRTGSLTSPTIREIRAEEIFKNAREWSHRQKESLPSPPTQQPTLIAETSDEANSENAPARDLIPLMMDTDSKTGETEVEEKDEEPLPQRVRRHRQSTLSFYRGGSTDGGHESGVPRSTPISESNADDGELESEGGVAPTASAIRKLQRRYIDNLMLPTNQRAAGRKWDTDHLCKECARLNIPFTNRCLKKLAEKLAKQVY